MAIVIESGSFLGIDWNAVSAGVTLLGLLIAGVGAYLAWTGLQRQIKEAATQHDATLAAQFRPLLLAESIRRTSAGSMVIGLKNIGLGPALDIQATVWHEYADTSDFQGDPPEDIQRSARGFLAASTENPGLVGSHPILAPNERIHVDVFVPRLGLHELDEMTGDGQVYEYGIAAVRLEYDDFAGTKFLASRRENGFWFWY